MENYLKYPRCEISNNRAPRDYIQFLFENLPDMEIQTHPEHLKQMLPWGKLILESFAQQNQAPDSAPGASCLSVNLLSPGGYVFQSSSSTRTWKQNTIRNPSFSPFSQYKNDPCSGQRR